MPSIMKYAIALVLIPFALATGVVADEDTPSIKPSTQFVTVGYKGCYWCSVLEGRLKKPAVANELKKFEYKKIDKNTIKGIAFVRKHKITLYPTILIIRGDKVLARVNGCPKEEDLIKLLKKWNGETSEVVQVDEVVGTIRK